jgi:hypothetical protein
MNHTLIAMSEADQHDCALTEEDIYHQCACIQWWEGLRRKEFHSVSRCYTNICMANRKNFRKTANTCTYNIQTSPTKGFNAKIRITQPNPAQMISSHILKKILQSGA